jgi:hypothetical protein
MCVGGWVLPLLCSGTWLRCFLSDSSFTTQVANDTSHKRQRILDERKSQQNMPSSFDLSYTNCRLQLGCDFFGEQGNNLCVATCPNS